MITNKLHNFIFKESEKEEKTKPTVNKMKETIKIRTEVNETE